MSKLPGADLVCRYVVAGLSAAAVLFGYLPVPTDSPEMALDEGRVTDMHTTTSD